MSKGFIAKLSLASRVTLRFAVSIGSPARGGCSRVFISLLVAFVTHADMVFHMPYAAYVLRYIGGPSFSLQVINRTGEYHLTFIDTHFQVRCINIGIIMEPVVDVFADALIGAQVVFRAFATMARTIIIVVAKTVDAIAGIINDLPEITHAGAESGVYRVLPGGIVRLLAGAPLLLPEPVIAVIINTIIIITAYMLPADIPAFVAMVGLIIPVRKTGAWAVAIFVCHSI